MRNIKLAFNSILIQIEHIADCQKIAQKAFRDLRLDLAKFKEDFKLELHKEEEVK